MTKDYFYGLVDRLVRQTQGREVLLIDFSGEDSDFVRFNRNRVRQAGSVRQRVLELELVDGQRHATASCDLSGAPDVDAQRLELILQELREKCRYLPEDPYLRYSTQVQDTEYLDDDRLPDSAEAIRRIVESAEGLDLVGIWACGAIHRGFANSLGQRNWHTTHSFNLDWSCHLGGDKSVKLGYAGHEWDAGTLVERMTEARTQLEVMGREPRTIEPGRYRVYLAPAALRELFDLLAWEAFGLRAHRTAQTPLLRMIREDRRLDEGITLVDDRSSGLAPRFTSGGFITPEAVTLIDRGAYGEALADPRSAGEYGVAVNSAHEAPEALSLAPGTLGRDEILERLGTGVYIGNLWYANFSDWSNARITGMTRFGCFWVEDGRICAPLNVMRFDETLYRILGDGLIGLTKERNLIHDSETYGGRSTMTYRLPGALVEGFTFTL